MKPGFLKWIRLHYSNVINSIAFLPAIIALIFLVVSWLMILLDFSPTGKQIKTALSWLSLKDATTARSIISAIVSGTISLTVFSFSLVMIILNQAASQMSNRVLDKLIGNRFQQLVLGFYIGTIVYALFLLSTIRDIDSGVYVPALSTYLLIAATIIDIFLFIYFLHYITQSVKYETIINRIYKQTLDVMQRECMYPQAPGLLQAPATGIPIYPASPGLFQGFNAPELLKLAEQEQFVIFFLQPPGTFILQHTPLALLSTSETFSKRHIEKIQHLITIKRGEEIESNYYYGFKQLTEAAVKALSPGINDPGTAVLCLQALVLLLAFRLQHFPDNALKDEKGSIRIIKKERTVAEIATACLQPIWHYGKDDPTIQQAFHQTLSQLHSYGKEPFIERLLQTVIMTMKERGY
jgi:uncharacterized membrane protein